jgi:hypothetical protein
MDDSEIETILTRLLEGPVGDRLCAKVSTQMVEAIRSRGLAFPDPIEPTGADAHDQSLPEPSSGEEFITRTEYEQKWNESADAIGKALKEAVAALSPFLDEIGETNIRLHNMELLLVTQQQMMAMGSDSPLAMRATGLEMALLNRVRERVIKDLETWSTKESLAETHEAMGHILELLYADAKSSN